MVFYQTQDITHKISESVTDQPTDLARCLRWAIRHNQFIFLSSETILIKTIILPLGQNVYVNIGRILAAAGKLIEGGHYAAGHVR